jgi:hypothetical protein
VHWFTRGLQPRVWNFRPPSIGCLRIAGCIPIWAAEERNSYARDSFAYGFDFTRPHSRHERVARLDALATLLDTAFILPGTNVRIRPRCIDWNENSGQPQHPGRNAGDHELRTSNNIDFADVNNEQKMR